MGICRLIVPNLCVQISVSDTWRRQGKHRELPRPKEMGKSAVKMMLFQKSKENQISTEIYIKISENAGATAGGGGRLPKFSRKIPGPPQLDLDSQRDSGGR